MAAAAVFTMLLMLIALTHAGGHNVPPSTEMADEIATDDQMMSESSNRPMKAALHGYGYGYGRGRGYGGGYYGCYGCNGQMATTTTAKPATTATTVRPPFLSYVGGGY
ncbi:hypothetical protein CHUAL_000665 [Chamberlinius hualienensis]